MHHVLARLKGTEAILEFDLVSLKDMSYVARGQLIDKWLSLEVPRESKDFSRKVEETERLVKTVIGKNTLPSLPFIVLSILQASQRRADILPENGSFGYLYEVLITAALNSTRGEKPQLDKKYTFLSLLAFRLFESSLDVLGESAVDSLIEEYARSFRIKVDNKSMLEDLEYARVLVKEDGNYSFTYAHYFHYFLARYFKDHLSGVQGSVLRRHMNAIAGQLNTGSNGIFLMFVIYLTHDDQLTDELVAIGQKILSEFPPSDLINDVDFYNSKEYTSVDPQIPESVDLDASRQRRRIAADLARERSDSESGAAVCADVENQGYSDEMPMRLKLRYAMSCLEILGQVLRNFTGSLPGERKLTILKTTYLLGLRILRAALTGLRDVTVKAREDLAKRDPRNSEERQFSKLIEKLLLIVGQIVGTSVFRSISLNVGSPDIEEEAYAETLDLVGHNNATELIDLAIKLDHFEEYPFAEIKSLHKRYEKNRFADDVLKSLVISNMHVFDIGREMRQRVLGTLKAGPPDPGVLSSTTKRFN